jgi:hypothetical protein
MKKLILIISLLINLTVVGQPFPIDTVFIGEMRYDVISINVKDSIYCLRVNNHRREGRNNTYIFIHNSVDTLNITGHERPIHFGEYLFFDNNYSGKNRPVWSYSDGLQYLNFDSPFFSDLGGDYIVMISGTNEADYLIDHFNPITNEKTLFLVFKDIPIPTISRFAPEGDWGVSRPFIIDDERAIIEIGYDINESGYNYYYFKHGNDIKIINELKDGTSTIDETLISNDRKVIAIGIRNNRQGERSITRPNLFTANLEHIGEILLRSTPTGLNMQKGKFSGYFLSAHLDNNFYAAFYYELNPTLELAMYKAFQNGILTQQDIKGLSKKELGILRNLLFAKHNYKFDSLYYQAYFKTLDFYVQLGRDSRTKNINHLLTEADKANIALIKSAEVRVKE